jgi:gamma-glutamyltranspeptidase/glutathione hydrolase
MKYNSFILFCLGFLLLSQVTLCQQSALNPYNYTSTKNQTCNKAAVVCAHPLAAQIGMQVLRKGGNAFDAAIAVQWALAVVYPSAGNLGGGGFMVARLSNGETTSLDFRETAPGKAFEDMYIDKKTGNANTMLSQNGQLSSGVPGTPAGLFATLKYAKLSMQTLIQPAIDLAENGFAITAMQASELNNEKSNFERQNAVLPVFVKRDADWKAGDTLIQKDLAVTLKRIRESGEKGFYEGETARLIVDEMKRGTGIITLKDLKNYKAIERPVIQFNYKGYSIISMAPPSSGGILLQQMLKMLEDRPLPQYGFETVKSVQLITEVERRAFADRAEHFGDPGFYKVPVQALVNDNYIKSRMADYDSTKASTSSNIKAGIIKESEQTTHISVLDEAGNAVSVTTTLNDDYGSKTVVAKAGFLLNNEMDDFSIQAGVPNLYGAVGGKANAIAPGKRMLSSMTPTIVLKNNKPFMVVGTIGGTTIITSILQTIVDIIDFGMNANDAVNKAKFHHQWLPDQIDVEAAFPARLRNELEAMGYTVKEREPIGRTELILVTPGGNIEAVADNRGDDSIAGW